MGDVVSIQPRYAGRVWQFNEDEDAALDYLPHGDQVLYLRGLRTAMDFATGIVGERRGISYQQLREVLEVQRRRGSTKPSGQPTKQAVRASLGRLEAAGLVERMSSGARVGDRLIFKLPLAHLGYVRFREEQHRINTGTTPQSSPELARVRKGMSNTESESMSNTHQNVSMSDKTTNVVSENSGELSRVDQGAGSSGIGPCPHVDILTLWREIFPQCSQPNPTLWSRGPSSANLRTRWREAAEISHSKTDLPLYTDRVAGLSWWRSFFEFLRGSCGDFLLADDSKFFDLHWILKRGNFYKALDGKYTNRRGASS